MSGEYVSSTMDYDLKKIIIGYWNIKGEKNNLTCTQFIQKSSGLYI